MATQAPDPAAAAESTVIRAKLGIPTLPDKLVDRPRVEDRIASLIAENRTVIVSATAGSGKTTAVAHALRRLELPVAWLSVDRTDSAPGRLVTYLEAALAEVLPAVRATATGALAAGLPAAEAAGLLAEAAGEEPLVLVLDELERLLDDSEAWVVIETLLRYAPEGMHIVLISRRKLPLGVHATSPRRGELATLADEDLAFTSREAGAALALVGNGSVDPRAAVEATGGWVTGVLFEAWRAPEHIAGSGGEEDPLHGYLSVHILDQLDPDDREFLVQTSLLADVTADRARALGQERASERLASLRRARLPAIWLAGGQVLRCHSRFREYLLDVLERREPEQVRRLRLAYGRLLAQEGHYEEATEALLRADAPEQALQSVERALIQVIERGDFAIAERWLAALPADARRGSPALAAGELMLAFGQEDYLRSMRVADALAERGQREQFARSFPLAAMLMAWSYAHAVRDDDMQAVVAALEPGPVLELLRYSLAGFSHEPPPERPDLPAALVDFLGQVDYVYGRLAGALQEPVSGWAQAFAQPWRMGALSVSGQTRRAAELYEELVSHGVATAWLEGYFGPQVLTDAGRGEEARATIDRGRKRALSSGSLLILWSSHLEEARLALRLEKDVDAALEVLDVLERDPLMRRAPVMGEQTDMWFALAHLRRSEDEAALTRARAAVASMTGSDRILELPTAAVYLAEAEWRAHNEEAADRAANLALEAAHRQGSNHLLLLALADFPSVVSRRLDVEPSADSPWHELGRALKAQDVTIEAPARSQVELREFGTCEIRVNGELVRPRIAKTYELLAYLRTRPGGAAEREQLLDALFESRTDDSARAYLRQAVLWLRRVMPGGEGVHSEGGSVRLGDEIQVTSESTRFEEQVAEAMRLHGETRLSRLLAALELYDQGEYLPVARSAWADERRRELGELAADARYEVAELSLSAGRYDDARRVVERVLELDPLRETAWRLRMRVANALGDYAGVIRAYERCERALAEIDASPSPTTRQLLDALRQ